MNLKEYLFSKKYGSLRYRVSYFFHSKIPFISPGWNEYRNPWYYWWKAREYFKRPKAHFLFRKRFWTFGLPIRRDYYNPVIDIGFHALGWKDKWDSPRHEWDPMICITFSELGICYGYLTGQLKKKRIVLPEAWLLGKLFWTTHVIIKV